MPCPKRPGQGPAWHGRRAVAYLTAGKLTGVPESAEPARWARPHAAAAVLAAALVAALASGIAGCAKFDAALGQRWATVNFKADTPIGTLLKVREACSHIPNVRAEALPRRQTPATMMYALTYRTDNASDANLAQLQQCLQQFPSVQGIQFGDAGDAG
jgi:hypothetical protein